MASKLWPMAIGGAVFMIGMSFSKIITGMIGQSGILGAKK